MHTPIFNVRCFKVGGIWFLRIGMFQFSFCICRRVPAWRKRCKLRPIQYGWQRYLRRFRDKGQRFGYRAYEPMLGVGGY